MMNRERMQRGPWQFRRAVRLFIKECQLVNPAPGVFPAQPGK